MKVPELCHWLFPIKITAQYGVSALKTVSCKKIAQIPCKTRDIR